VVELEGLPGAELVRQGLDDLAARRHSVPALLVAGASTRLRRVGLEIPPHEIREAELSLYRALCNESSGGAYARYNALLAELTSFARALEREVGAKLRAARSG
jgi:hypothetical protein